MCTKEFHDYHAFKSFEFDLIEKGINRVKD